MKVTVKIGTKEGFTSSYNLFFENGLRLKTDDLTFRASSESAETRRQFEEVVAALKRSGFTVEEFKK